MTAARWFVIALTVTLGSFAHAQGPAPRGQARSEAVSWSGCQVVELTGTVREVRCPDFALRLLQAASLTDAASLAALVTAFPEGADTRPGELRVGRSTVPTMESSAMLFAVPYPGIGAGCMEPMGERRDRCRSALVEMARTRQLPPGVVFPEARMHFLGHALVLQRGCTMVGTERISCARTLQRALRGDPLRRDVLRASFPRTVMARALRPSLRRNHSGAERVAMKKPPLEAFGALGVFTTREAAEEFVKDDPFVLNGVVARYSFQDWDEVLG